MLFSFSHKDMSWDKAEKNSLSQLSLSLSYFSFLSMHEAVGETVLPNSFSKAAQLYIESCS